MATTKVLLLSYYTLLAVSSISSESGVKESEINVINFLALLPYEIQGSSEQPWLKQGPMLQPGAELAVEQINQREDLLVGYSVNLTVANSACNIKVHTIINFVTALFYSGVKFAGIVGPVCSDAVKLISPITRQEGVSLLNFHAGSSQQFTDRNRYRYAFSTVSSTNPFIELFLHLMKDNEWESVAVLYEQQATVYLNAYDLLVEKLPHIYPEGKIIFSAPVSEESLPLSSIIRQHLRVVILITTPNIAHKILCLIQTRYPELTFPAYQFILFGGYYYRSVSFTLSNQHYKCSAAEIGRVMDRFLLTGLKLDVANSTELVSGVTYAENFQEYEERANGSITLRANALYDGVWSLALALNNSIPRLNEIGLDLVDYTYGHREATDIIRDEVLKLHFQGASGHISFSKDTGFTTSSVPLHQMIDNTSVPIGNYNEETEELVIFGDGVFVESTFESMELVVHPALASLFLLIAVLALVLIISTHVATLVFSSFPAIRASSYHLGQLAFIGCYLIVLCFLCFTIREVATSTSVSITSLCVIPAWCLPLGLTLILGTLTAKTWRLYRIFVHLKKPGKVPGDKVLVTAVLLLACFDIVFCSIWSARFPFATLCHETVTDDNTIEVRVECYSEYYYAWFGALTLYQGLIMASALVLALLTKNIRHKSFKTKSVTLLVYSLTITLSLGFPLYLILNASRVSGVNVEYVVLSLTYLAVVCLCFVFLFFPPILSLLREKLLHKIRVLRKYSTNVSRKSPQLSSFHFHVKKEHVVSHYY